MEKAVFRAEADGSFTVEGYRNAKPFAGFLPAVAGLHGKPAWVYYVSRGQCVSTFGVNNKDSAVMEFQPANAAYRRTPLEGFRTFLRLRRPGGKTVFYEPFREGPLPEGRRQSMRVSPAELSIEETDPALGVRVRVRYATLPGEPLAALMRSVRVENLSPEPLAAQLLDGMPVLLPYRIPDLDLKSMSNLRQAWMRVEHLESIPYYRIKALPDDTPETVALQGGNFFLSFRPEGESVRLNRVVVDPACVFGPATGLSYPAAFAEGEEFRFPEYQPDAGYTPCGFSFLELRLSAGGAQELCELIGAAPDWRDAEELAERLTPDYPARKREENRLLIEKLKSPAFTASALPALDAYCGQTFLDNLLRGGCPVPLGGGRAFYVYSRKHGDLEREYNFFQVDAAYWSQGNSNYRDVNQNRRNDVWFYPFVGDANIRLFWNLIQLDGYNPLVLCGTRFRAGEKALRTAGALLVDASDAPAVAEFLAKPFTPGDLPEFLESGGIRVEGGGEAFLRAVLAECESETSAQFGEGYWTDHWTYNTDLMEQYLSVFPEKEAELFFGRADYTWYDGDEYVLPRSEKYVLTPNGPRQYGALRKVPEKTALLASRAEKPNAVRTEYGKGRIYTCTLAAKILLLLANKIASLDSFGAGVEMEANKPGWCDALNGLPGLFGSSLCETAETARLARMLLRALAVPALSGRDAGLGADSEPGSARGTETSPGCPAGFLSLPEEGAVFLRAVSALLVSCPDGFEYWEKSSSAREEFRRATVFGISGREERLPAEETADFLRRVIAKAERGVSAGTDPATGIPYTYFLHEAERYEALKDGTGAARTNADGLPLVRVLAFRQKPVAFFLEGPVHVLRLKHDAAAAHRMDAAVRRTGLYDEKLRMYKVCADVSGEPQEIGRQNVFPRGWLENEAVFLHMEYKYLLELLRSGAYGEFFAAAKTALIPFLDPAVYGRSIYENSSFLASSVHPDPRVHGQGFVSRLTGASAEFLSMLRYVEAGPAPFALDEGGGLIFAPRPVLPAGLFLREGRTAKLASGGAEREIALPADSFAFLLPGGTAAVYRNPRRKDTFGPGAVSPLSMTFFRGGRAAAEAGPFAAGELARSVRSGEFGRAEILLG